MGRQQYTIVFQGCDDKTVFDMMLSDDQFELVERLSTRSVDVSESVCMPTLDVYGEDDDG